MIDLLRVVSRQCFAFSEPRIEIAFEGRRRVNALDDNKIIVLPFQARRRKVRGAGAQQSPVDLVAFEVHRRAGLVLDPYLDTRRLGEVIENRRGLALGKLGAVEIDADMDATIGCPRERLQDRPIRQDIGGHVNFMLGAINQVNVDVLKVLDRRIVNCWRGIGAPLRA